MNEKNPLKETFEQTQFQLAGHGKRTVSILKDVVDQVDENIQSDHYGAGKVIDDFQVKMAEFLGKETAIFFPSGTMAQQIALRIWSDEKNLKKVAYHPLSHLEIHEEGGLKELHHIETVLLADKNRVIEFEDVTGMNEEVACILLELPQREIGGQLPSYETLEQISEWSRDKGIKLHLDGARLLEVLPYYQKSAAEIASLFDSVYISLYKGIGAIAGAILAGDEKFIKQSKIWKRRHGGDLISLYPYILPADYYFEKRSEKMAQYFEEAREVAQYFNSCEAISTLPLNPVSNMFHVYFSQPKERIATLLAEVHEESGVGFSSYLTEKTEESCYFEVSLGDLYADIPKEKMAQAFRLLNEKLSSAIKP
ncbi:threonine aldolase family protein [Planococcus shenhongbingii]|uniref:Beta-eliminating lyase-related protein n=1 Tax=Planococcus shenhongbingii TaxID=3058398 RepID=A0ABT8N9X2_9BACL|nr:beta-eliminating lyase-related protein [Planococcus sp. N017]MDN7244553.1 beta-eliminating lyase-related protein [Planococcus sp. N017]